MPSCSGKDRDCVFRNSREWNLKATSFHAKAGRLPNQVARHERTCENLRGGKANDGGGNTGWCTHLHSD
jgi:hypothetical protein